MLFFFAEEVENFPGKGRPQIAALKGVERNDIIDPKCNRG